MRSPLQFFEHYGLPEHATAKNLTPEYHSLGQAERTIYACPAF
jgi:hypothetical protein